MIHIFLVNPYAGKKTFADDLREKLKRIHGLQYFIFYTRYAGNEMEMVKLVQETFAGEKLRFYCCGGSGTIRNIMNGFDNLADVELAWFPCGRTNDFLKVFGPRQDKFHVIEELINGEILPVDYIESTDGVMLNAMSLGLDACALQKTEDYNFLRTINYELALNAGIAYSLFVPRMREYEIVTSNAVLTGNVTEVFFGNGTNLGDSLNFVKEGSAVDGLANYSIIMEKNRFKALPPLKALLEADFDYIHDNFYNGYSKFIRIRRKDGTPFQVNQDGELSKPYSEWEAHIVERGLQLVVPKGVTLYGKQTDCQKL